MQTGLPIYMQDDVVRQHQTYQQKVEAQLARWRADIVNLEAGMPEAQTSDRITLQEHLTALKTKLYHAEKQLEELKEATGEAWTELKAEIDATWNDLSQSIEQAQKE